MQSVTISVRFVLLFTLVLLAVLPAHADYLVGPGPVMVPGDAFVEPVVVECGPCCQRHHKHHYKKHYVAKHHKHYRHHRSHADEYAVPVCTSRYHPQHEPVAFSAGAPGRGGYVSLSDCEPYDPDLTTGDDDPTIYPGMDIDN